jgi:hypothetical protein
MGGAVSSEATYEAPFIKNNEPADISRITSNIISQSEDDDASQSPVAAVIETVELLEQVLLNLDGRTLLLSQRVNKTFSNVIAGSIKLQRKLFFKPVDSFQEAIDLGIGCDDGIIGIEHIYETKRRGDFLDKPTFVNTLLIEPYNGNMSAYEFANFCSWVKLYDSINEDAVAKKSLAKEARAKGISRNHSSWERMLLSQPPLPSRLMVYTQAISSPRELEREDEDDYRWKIRVVHSKRMIEQSVPITLGRVVRKIGKVVHAKHGGQEPEWAMSELNIGCDVMMLFAGTNGCGSESFGLTRSEPWKAGFEEHNWYKLFNVEEVKSSVKAIPTAPVPRPQKWRNRYPESDDEFWFPIQKGGLKHKR